MATTRINEKISELVNSQLPEFIRSDYTTFVAFLEYYYKFLEQDQGALELVQNARQYSDIDKTTSSFVNYFLANYANDLPISLQVNKSLLIKKIEGLYKAKGSTLSIETLFKVLYDTVATTSHPYDYVLRPSDGSWNQRSSIRVLLTSGSIEGITDRFLTYSKNNIEYSAAILRVKSISSNLYEIFYNSRSNVPFEVDDDVVVNNSAGTIFTGTIKPTTTSYEISFGGTGFRVGEIFNLTTGGVETLVRITRVGANGSIQALKFINFGYNYSSNFTITLSNSLGVATSTKYFDTITGGFQESFTLVGSHTNINPNRYFDSDYVTPFNYTGNTFVSSTTTSQLITSATTGGTSNPSDAILTFNVGAVARYPGEYSATQGFISEPDVRLQDQYLYQPFAYQVESELDISVFYDLVKKLVHQAGTNLFVNRALTSTASVSASVEVVSTKNVFTQLNSVFSTLDSKIYNFTKSLTDNLTPIESLTYNMNKLLTDDFITLESLTNNFGKSLSDDFTVSDNLTINISKLLSDNTIIEDNLISAVFAYFLTESDSTTISENLTITFNTTNSDSVTPSDNTSIALQLAAFTDNTTFTDSAVIDFKTTIEDNTTVTESFIQNINKSISNADSTVSFIESGSGVLLNYVESSYFSEIYVGETVLTIS